MMALIKPSLVAKGSRNIHTFDYISLNCDHDLEDSKRLLLFFVLFLHDTPAYDVTPCQVWLQNVQQLRWYDPYKQLLFRWFAVTLALKTGIQYIHWTLWFWMIYHQNKFGCKRMSPKDTIETVTFWLYEPSLWPWPWRQHPNLFTCHSTWRWRNTTWRWCNSITTLVTKRYKNQHTDQHTDRRTWWFQYILPNCVGEKRKKKNGGDWNSRWKMAWSARRSTCPSPPYAG